MILFRSMDDVIQGGGIQILFICMCDISHVYVWYYSCLCMIFFRSMFDSILFRVGCSGVDVGLYSDVIEILFHDKCNIIPFSIWYYSMINVIIITHYCDTSREPVWDHSVYKYDTILWRQWYYFMLFMILFIINTYHIPTSVWYWSGVNMILFSIHCNVIPC